MSGYIAKDKPIGAATWLVVGGVFVGVAYLMFRGVSAASALLIVRAPGRQVKMPGGSTPQNLATLKAAFGPLVQDLGNGVYAVVVATDTTASIPGAAVL